uniref:Cofilin n=1 Tax=Aplysia kurodai TaxID=6501 RepID=Q38RA2_APLKU|nr:cofilin [Aplysia kurodai]
MSSGIKIADTVKEVYNRISMNSVKQTKLKYGVFKFADDGASIVVETTATNADAMSYDDLVSGLPKDDVRYIAYDFDFLSKDNVKTSEIVLVSWAPEKSPIKRKMMCASTFNALKSALSVSKNVLQGDSFDEVDSVAALEKVGGKPLP